AAVRALPELQRIYTCRPEASPAYWKARAGRPQAHEALTLASWADSLTPHFNRPAHVLTALSEDLTALVPLDRLLPPGVGCADDARLVPALRQAGVSHVLSLAPLAGPGLTPAGELAPDRLAPLRLFIYAVERPLPLRFLASGVRDGRGPSEVTETGTVA